MFNYQNLKRTNIKKPASYFSFSSLEEFYNTSYKIKEGDLILFWNRSVVFKFINN